MSRRMEIELTSDRGDGSWTWRAAGARQPRGVVGADMVPSGAKVGDVLRAEVDIELEGITVLALGANQTRERTEPEKIEVLGSTRRDDEQLVTTRLVSKGRPDRDRRPRRDGEGRTRGDGGRPDGGRERNGRPAGPGADSRDGRDTERRERRPRSERPGGDRADRRPRHPAPPPLPERPKPKRLRPGRTHRKAVLAELPPEHQPIAEEVLRGGIPGVRQAIEAENEKRTAAGESAIDGKELLRLAEQLLPRMRTADWRDRADAALADGDELDLRDLRSVVVAADSAARDDETRELAARLRTKLEERLVSEQARWLDDLRFALDAGRIVRALRDSSRPPKAGAMLPPELRLALLGGANAALTAEATAERWAAVLDAIAHSPVRTEVAPVSTPEAPSTELVAVIERYASRVPKVALAFGIQPAAPARKRGRAPRPPAPRKRAGAVPVPERPADAGLAVPEPRAPQAPQVPEPDAPTEASVEVETATVVAPEPADEPAQTEVETATVVAPEPADEPAQTEVETAEPTEAAQPAEAQPTEAQPAVPAEESAVLSDG